MSSSNRETILKYLGEPNVVPRLLKCGRNLQETASAIGGLEGTRSRTRGLQVVVRCFIIKRVGSAQTLQHRAVLV